MIESDNYLLIQGDCLDEMGYLEEGSIDMVLTDMPYGSTESSWDFILPLGIVWDRLERISKQNTGFVFTSDGILTAMLIMSRKELYKYTCVWDRISVSGHLTANIKPMKQHEDIVIFGKGKITYNPEMETRGKPRLKGRVKDPSGVYGKYKSRESHNNRYYPKTIIRCSNTHRANRFHPNEKPVLLMRYLIRLYSNPGDTVLDFTMGSGSTGVACILENRKFIGIEKDPEYFPIAKRRIEKAQKTMMEKKK